MNNKLTGKIWLSQNEAFAALVALSDDEDTLIVGQDLWLARWLI